MNTGLYSEQDAAYMAAALKLAHGVKGNTFPNPAVGAIVVNSGAVAGEGATSACGGPHAEKKALAAAGPNARGGTLYVTLEPCDHFGKTPPCTDAIIAAGIKKVFLSIKDPNPLVAGRGIRRLKKAGIQVSCGLMGEEAARLNEDFFWSITHGLSWVTLKLALTLDGRLADAWGDSKWISSTESRKFVHELRRRHAAVAVGSGTLLSDDPKLSVRHVKGANPARIIFSSSPNPPAKSYFLKTAAKERSIIVIGGKRKPLKTKSDNGIERWFTGERHKGKSLRAFLSMACEEGMTSILLEGGQKLASAFMEYDLVNRIYLFYGNKMIGKGKDGLLFDRGLPVAHPIVLDDKKVTVLGDDVMVTGIPKRK